MLRTLEAAFVVMITLGALYSVTSYVSLPTPREVSSVGQQELAQNLMEKINQNNALTNAVFSGNETGWSNVVQTITNSIPPNTIFNITAYNISEDAGKMTFSPIKTGSNFQGVFPSGSVSVSYTMSSPNVTETQTPEKISYKDVSGNQIYTTLYILNCTDANGWWVTGFTRNSIVSEVYKEMSPYFKSTILVNNTAELERLLNGNKLTGNPNESVGGAIILNTCGEVVPIPTSMVSNPTQFPYYLGTRTNTFNWTWVSIVGWPFYYVSNKNQITWTSWGINGTYMLGNQGLNAFVQGINLQPFKADTTTSKVTSIGAVSYNDSLKKDMDYYGIYPGQNQTSTRAIYGSWLFSNNFVPSVIIFNYVNGNYRNGIYAGAIWAHKTSGVTHGSFMQLGLARTPDIKVAIIGLLAQYRPTIYRSDFNFTGTTRIVTLQLGQLGAS